MNTICNTYHYLYNYRNLPVTVKLVNNVEVSYTYDAEGTKLTRKIKQGNGATQQTNYEGSFVYQTDANNKLALSYFAHTQGGRVTVTNNIYKYEYFLADHLGNVRATFGADQNGNLDILQTTDYYPFGLTMAGNKTYSGQEYQYGGKEWQNATNVYDFHARQYNPALGRWFNQDPMMEKYTSVSPYNYCLNNPISYIDPDGMDVHLEGAAAQSFFKLLQHGAYSGWSINGIHQAAFECDSRGGSGGGGGSSFSFMGGNGNYYTVFFNSGGGGHVSSTPAMQTSDGSLIGIGETQFYSFNSGDQNSATNQVGDAANGEGADFGIANDIIGGASVVNGLVGFDAAINSTHTLRYAQRVNGVVKSAAELTAINQARALKVLNASKSFGSKLGVAGGVVIAADVIYNSEIKASHGINAVMTGIAFTGWGAPFAGLWFVADFGTGLITGTSISDRIDSSVGAPLVNW